jgi:hypothetical protein
MAIGTTPPCAVPGADRRRFAPILALAALAAAVTARALPKVEERWFSDWYPFRLFRVGGAVFADLGRTWGDAPFASPSEGLLGDAGFGLRIGNARSGGAGNVLHVDLAFPLGGPSDVDSMQLLLQAHHSF